MTSGLGAGQAEKLLTEVKKWNEANNCSVLQSVMAGGQAPETPGKGTGGQGPSTPRRTLCTPQFEPPDLPVTVTQVGVPMQKMLLSQFQEEEPHDART